MGSQHKKPRERLEQILPWTLQKGTSLPTPWSWTSVLQNCKRTHFCRLSHRPPHLWCFFTAAPGHSSRESPDECPLGFIKISWNQRPWLHNMVKPSRRETNRTDLASRLALSSRQRGRKTSTVLPCVRLGKTHIDQGGVQGLFGPIKVGWKENKQAEQKMPLLQPPPGWQGGRAGPQRGRSQEGCPGAGDGAVCAGRCRGFLSGQNPNAFLRKPAGGEGAALGSPQGQGGWGMAGGDTSG